MGKWNSVLAASVVFFWGTDKYLWRKLQDTNADTAIFVIICTLCVCAVLASFFSEDREGRQVWLFLWIFIAIVFGSIGCYLVWTPGNPTATVAVAAAALATIGWLVQRDNALFINRKQHTLSILMQMRQSETFNSHRNRVHAKFPPGTGISRQDVQWLLEQRKDPSNYADGADGKPQYPLIDSIQFLANFYEFLSAAVRQKDLDESLLYESIGNIAINYYEKVAPWLRHFQQPGPDGAPSTDTYNHYWWLYQRWKARAES